MAPGGSGGGPAPAEREAALSRIATARLEGRIGPLVAALDAGGVPAVVLKGPSTRLRLYGPREVRPTSDIDLLVPARRRRRADAVLAGLGYQSVFGMGHADTWQGPDGTYVDLHVTLPYAGREPQAVWHLLAPHVVDLEVTGAPVPVLDEPAHLLHLAIHAIQGGPTSSRRPEDELRRGLAVLGPEHLAASRALARQLGLEGVLDVAIEHAATPLDRAELASRLPQRTLAAGGIRAFLRSPVSWGERWRGLRRPLLMFWSDRRIASWLRSRGRPVPTDPWGLRRAKVHRLLWVGTREARSVLRRGRPGTSER